ncbi:MAG: BtpA/SgcQ family protein [bacterium]
MVHLRPLPGAPGWASDLHAVEAAALADATALAAGGVGAIMVENFHDVPFFPDTVPPVTIAAMTLLVGRIRDRFPQLPLGINVLRNDAVAALSIAAVTGADFIRVNVHAGSVVTDQRLLHGQAESTLRRRNELGCDVGILADLRVKHARPLAERALGAEAADLRERALADGLICSGTATGATARPEELREVRETLPDCPLLVGSGMTAANVADFAPWADGFIVGTSLKDPAGGPLSAINPERVAAFVAAVQATSPGGEKESS